jgi:hypothetical protein
MIRKKKREYINFVVFKYNDGSGSNGDSNSTGKSAESGE